MHWRPEGRRKRIVRLIHKWFSDGHLYSDSYE
jgi:hypothetical protein